MGFILVLLFKLVVPPVVADDASQKSDGAAAVERVLDCDLIARSDGADGIQQRLALLKYTINANDKRANRKYEDDIGNSIALLLRYRRLKENIQVTRERSW